MATDTERYFPGVLASDLRDVAYACAMVEECGGRDDDWNAPEAMEARRLTKKLGWSWDFSTWSHAASILEHEAKLADMETPD